MTDLVILKKLFNKEQFDSFDPKDKIFALLSSEVYNAPFARSDIEDYKYLSIYSNNDVGVWVNEDDEGIISIKGTNNINDLIKDVKISLDRHPMKNFERISRNILKIRTTLTNIRFKLTGHSLGGLRVMFHASKYRGSGVVFNPFIPNIGFKIINMITETPGIKKYTIIGDPLSNNIAKIPNEDSVKVLSIPNVGLLNKHGIKSYL